MPSDRRISAGESVTMGDLIMFFFVFYLIGIVVWLAPYLLLALILFVWSFE